MPHELCPWNLRAEQGTTRSDLLVTQNGLTTFSLTTEVHKLPRAAMSFLRGNHLYSKADIYRQAIRISLQAHPLICCRCCRKTSIVPPTHHQLGHYLPKLYHPMALRLSISSSHGPAISTCRPATCSRFPASLGSGTASQKRSVAVMSVSEASGVTPVQSGSLETATVGANAVAVTGQVTEVSKDTFWPTVKAAAPKLVVLDMYTQWCGPCKVMAPRFQEMSEKDHDVVFLKLDCNQDNRPLAKELGIRVVPTFKIFKDGKVVKEVTGAKIEELAHAIEEAKSS